MKLNRYFMPVAALLLAANAYAQDPSFAVTIENFSIKAGEEKVIELNVDNSIEFVAFQMDIEFPEGLSIPLRYNEDLEEDELSVDLTSRKKGHTLSAKKQGDTNVYRFACFSNNNYPFKNNTGAIMNIKVVASDKFTAETGTVRIFDALLCTKAAVEYPAPESTCTVTNTTGIESVSYDAAEAAEYFNLQGIRVENPSNGVYLRKVGDKVSKIAVK